MMAVTDKKKERCEHLSFLLLLGNIYDKIRGNKAKEPEMKQNIIISACLLGEPCRYDGASKCCPLAYRLREKYNLIPICPEVFGGLPTPRVPSEIIGDRVVNKQGVDVSKEYRRGAEVALTLAREGQVAFAVLKARSPSCGKGKTYDGTFTGTLTDRHGITVEAFLEAGIPVYTEDEIERLI